MLDIMLADTATLSEIERLRRYNGRVMDSARELSLREKIRRALVEEMPEASEENVEKALNRIMTAVDPFERAAIDVLRRYEMTFAELAH